MVGGQGIGQCPVPPHKEQNRHGPGMSFLVLAGLAVAAMCYAARGLQQDQHGGGSHKMPHRGLGDIGSRILRAAADGAAAEIEASTTAPSAAPAHDKGATADVTSACDGLDPSGTALVIAAVKLSGWALEQIKTFARQSAAAVDDDGGFGDLWLVVDNSSEATAGWLAAKQLKPELAKGMIKLAIINSSLCYRLYPEFDEVFSRLAWAKHITRAWGKAWKAPKGPGAFFHTQTTDMWREQACRAKKRYAQVWAFEADVGYTGKTLDQLFGAYDDSADLVATACIPAAQKDWMHIDTVTDQFGALISRASRYYMLEFAIRLSDRLMDLLHAWSVLGRIAYSEMTPCSLVMHKSLGLSMITLNPKHIGKIWSTSKHPSITNWGNWKKTFRKGDQKQGRARLYHPVKI